MSNPIHNQTDANQLGWSPYKNGATIGTEGSEGGLIITDEQFGADTRITLEKIDHTAPYAITCGHGGLFVHTHYFDDNPQTVLSAMKADLAHLIIELEAMQHMQTYETDASTTAIRVYIAAYP